MNIALCWQNSYGAINKIWCANLDLALALAKQEMIALYDGWENGKVTKNRWIQLKKFPANK